MASNAYLSGCFEASANFKIFSYLCHVEFIDIIYFSYVDKFCEFC